MLHNVRDTKNCCHLKPFWIESNLKFPWSLLSELLSLWSHMMLFYSGANSLRRKWKWAVVSILQCHHIQYVNILFLLQISSEIICMEHKLRTEASRHHHGCSENHSDENCLAWGFCGCCPSFLSATNRAKRKPERQSKNAVFQKAAAVVSNHVRFLPLGSFFLNLEISVDYRD